MWVTGERRDEMSGIGTLVLHKVLGTYLFWKSYCWSLWIGMYFLRPSYSSSNEEIRV